MDTLPQSQPEEPKKNILLKELEFGVGGVMIGLLSFLLLLFTLNYFNIVSLSLVFPNQLGFLPHRQYSQQKPPAPVFNFTQKEAPTGASPTPIQSGPTPTPIKLTLSCPVAQEFCSKARIIKEGDFYGLGFNLPQGTPLLAVFEGTLSDITPQLKERSPNHPLLALKDKEENEANYSFYGTGSASLAQTAQKGSAIGQIGEEIFPPYPPLAGLNFLFTVKVGGKTIELNPNNFAP